MKERQSGALCMLLPRAEATGQSGLSGGLFRGLRPDSQALNNLTSLVFLPLF
jgi:hypothetical protein